MKVEPYLFFEGRCDEAIDFYQKNLGAQVQMLARYSDNPDPAAAHGAPDKVMYASLRIGDSNVLVSDGRCTGKADFAGFALSLTINDEAGAERVFKALANGGHVQAELTRTFFSPRFGMVTDRFGVLWIIYATG